MNKNIRLLFLIAFLSCSKISFAQSEWGNWGRMTCHQGFEARVKFIGYNKVVSQYEWIAQVRNNYGIKATFNMEWTVGGEKHNIGQFTVKPGNTTNAVSYYFNSNASICLVTVGDVCFGELAWCSCKSDCDATPGVPNQISEEACKALTSPQKTNTSSNTPSNNSSVKNTSTNPSASKNTNQNSQAGYTDYDGGSELAPPAGGQKSTSYNTNTTTQQVYQNALNQYSQTQVSNTIKDIQNTPITTFSLPKTEIEIVKKKPGTLDKGTAAGIITSGNIEVDLPEFSNTGSDKKTLDIGQTSNWLREDKQTEIMIGKTETGIYWKLKNDKEYIFFKKINPGIYRYDVGNDFFMAKFETDNRISFWHTGVLENYYNLIPATVNIDSSFKIQSGIWTEYADGKVNITVTNDGLLYHIINSVDNGTQFYKKIAFNEYKWFDPDGVHYCLLRLISSVKMEMICNERQIHEYTFISEEAGKN